MHQFVSPQRPCHIDRVNAEVEIQQVNQRCKKLNLYQNKQICVDYTGIKNKIINSELKICATSEKFLIIHSFTILRGSHIVSRITNVM